MYYLRHRPTDPTSLESAILGRSAPTDRPAPSARRGPATPGTARPTDPLRHTLTLRTPSERADRPTHLWLVAPEVARLALLELFAFGSGRCIQAHQVLAMRLVCLRGCHHRRAVACVELVRTTTRCVREHGALTRWRCDRTTPLSPTLPKRRFRGSDSTDRPTLRDLDATLGPRRPTDRRRGRNCTGNARPSDPLRGRPGTQIIQLTSHRLTGFH